ncbi:MAG TPA: hypothetical protein VE131_01875 [Terriglobales bacterium]|nr:hypothetical protein [Terriglobales bacterium]
MSDVKKIRESVEAKLDKLDARVDALQASLKDDEADRAARIDRHRQEARRALEKLNADVGEQTDFSEARKQEIRSLVDNLNAQLTLSEAAARETLAYARQQISAAVEKLEAELDAMLADSRSLTAEMLRTSIGSYGRALDKLDAELEAAEIRVAAARGKWDAAFEKRRQEMAQEIAKLKQRLGEKKMHASERLVKFEEELRDGVEKMARAFKNLFG